MTALGLLAGVALDQVLGDPRRGHPVALFGAVAGRLEDRMWRDRRRAGVQYTALLAGSAARPWGPAGRTPRGPPWPPPPPPATRTSGGPRPAPTTSRTTCPPGSPPP